MSPLTAANQPCNLKKICVLSTLLFITCISYSQSFFKLIASKQLNANYCRDIMQTNDGGYLLAGGSTLQTDDTYANAKGFLVKLNTSGDTVWTRRFESNCQAWNGLIPTSDGNFLAVGAYDLNKLNQFIFPKASIAKFNNAGSVLWQKNMEGTFSAFAFSCGLLTKDGSNIIVGASSATLSTDAGVYILNLASTGNIAWNKVLTAGGKQLLPSSVKELIEGGFIITGIATTSDNQNDIFVMKTDASGNLAWCKFFGKDTDSDTGAGVIETSDSGFLLAGSTSTSGSGSSDFTLIKLDKDGNIVWNKTYGKQGTETAYSFIPYENDNYVIMGLTNSFNSVFYDTYLLIVDGNGNVQQSKRVPSGAGPELTLTRPQMIKNTNGDYVLGGNFINPNNSSIDLGIIKFESDFVSCSNTVDATYDEGEGPVSYTLDFASTSRGSFSNMNVPITSGGSVTTICSNIPVTNVKSGNWSDPATWSNHQVPSATDKVELNFDVVVDINADCFSLKTNNHQVHVNANILMNIHGK